MRAALSHESLDSHLKGNKEQSPFGRYSLCLKFLFENHGAKKPVNEEQGLDKQPN